MSLSLHIPKDIRDISLIGNLTLSYCLSLSPDSSYVYVLLVSDKMRETLLYIAKPVSRDCAENGTTVAVARLFSRVRVP